jgi:hypothetical protein
MSDARRSQTRAAIAFVAIVLAIGASFGACTDYQRQNGEECLKGTDCVSNYCLAQACASPPPILIGSSYEEAGQSEDSGGGVESGSGAPDTGTSSDSASKADSSGDSSADGPPARDEAGQDSGEEDASDVSLDATDSSEVDASDDSNGDTEDATPDGADALFLSRRAELPA